MTQDKLLQILAALDNPHRLRIISFLHASGRHYISQLAREIGISRPLLHMHLQKLQEAGLVVSKHEVSDAGKALNYFEVVNFFYGFNPSGIADMFKLTETASSDLLTPA